MRKIYFYGIIVFAAIGMASCSDDDAEILEPTTGYNDNKFAVPADATGPEADLRREFYADHGINLVFSEILEREYLGKDAYGDDVWKEHKIDFRYNLTSMSEEGPTFTEYDNIEDKKAATCFVEDYILPHISESSLKPFSFLLVDALKKPRNGTWGTLIDGKYVSCWRAMALAIGDVADMSDAEKRDLSVSLLKDIVNEKLDKYSKSLDPFYDLSYEYDNERVSDYDPNWDRTDMSIVYEMGYLSYFEHWRGPERDYFDAYTDFDDYYDAVMSRDYEDFMAEFADYPRVITKYNLVRACIIDAGYKF